MNDEGVQRYIDTKRAVVRNMGRIQDYLTILQLSGWADAERQTVLRKVQAILDDPFQADGLPASP